MQQLLMLQLLSPMEKMAKLMVKAQRQLRQQAKQQENKERNPLKSVRKKLNLTLKESFSFQSPTLCLL